MSTLIWSDRVNSAKVGVFVVGLALSRGQSEQQQPGQVDRRLISLIFAGRNRIIHDPSGAASDCYRESGYARANAALFTRYDTWHLRASRHLRQARITEQRGGSIHCEECREEEKSGIKASWPFMDPRFSYWSQILSLSC